MITIYKNRTNNNHNFPSDITLTKNDPQWAYHASPELLTGKSKQDKYKVKMRKVAGGMEA